MRWGDIVLVAAPGDCGKPRPAVIVQLDWLSQADSVLVCLVTSTVRDASIVRLIVEPLPENGLRATSQVMVDKIAALPHVKCGAVVGHLDEGTVATLGQMLAVVLGLAD